MAANIHTHNFRQCSHASVGLARARPIIFPGPASSLYAHSATYVESSADGYHCCAILRSLTDATKALIPWFNPAEPSREGTRTSSGLHISMYYFGPATSSPSLELDHPSTSGI